MTTFVAEKQHGIPYCSNETIDTAGILGNRAHLQSGSQEVTDHVGGVGAGRFGGVTSLTSWLDR